jgi:hypothetical protein
MNRCLVTGKRMLTRKGAHREAVWWRRSRLARMQHYSCGSCGAYHVGNSQGRKPRRRGKARRP